MTNFDPAGLLMLFTLVVALPSGAVSIAGAHLAARLDVGDYETAVAVLLGLSVTALVLAGLVVSDAFFQLLGIVLAMVGAYAATRSVRDASYGWLLGVVVLFLAYWAASAVGIYRGVDRQGEPIGVVARNLPAFYFGGLLVAGAVGGAAVAQAGSLLGGDRQVEDPAGG